MRISRESLLQSLETVSPGLAKRDVVEQSSCFVFRDGQVITFNDEVCCRQTTELKIDGALPAAPLITILRKLSDDSLKVDQSGEEVVFIGRNRRLGVVLEKEVFLPFDKVELPSKWKKLPAAYSDAVRIVEMCASKDESRFMLMCVHIHPKYMEACDNYHLCRYKMTTGVSKPCFVRRDSIKCMTELGMTHFSESPAWMHYKNPSGMVMSCRRVVDQDYPDLSPILEERGEKAVLPKGLAEAADRCGVFSTENQDDDNSVTVDIRSGKLRITGRGVTGWYQETKKLEYSGKSMSFLINPDLLSKLVKSYSDCEMSENYLRVDGESFTYVTCLGREKESSHDEEV